MQGIRVWLVFITTIDAAHYEPPPAPGDAWQNDDESAQNSAVPAGDNLPARVGDWCDWPTPAKIVFSFRMADARYPEYFTACHFHADPSLLKSIFLSYLLVL